MIFVCAAVSDPPPHSYAREWATSKHVTSLDRARVVATAKTSKRVSEISVLFPKMSGLCKLRDRQTDRHGLIYKTEKMGARKVRRSESGELVRISARPIWKPRARKTQSLEHQIGGSRRLLCLSQSDDREASQDLVSPATSNETLRVLSVRICLSPNNKK